MMGRQQRDQGRLFYEFQLEDRIPENHLLRRMNVFVTATLADLDKELEPYYSEIGRPSIDPELMIRMLIVGYCYGIRSERKLCQEVELHLAYRWFCKLDLDDKVPHHSTFSENRLGRFRKSDLLRQRTAAQVPDGDRRMDKGGPGDRGRWAHPLSARDRSAGAARVRARGAALSALRQRAGVRVAGAAQMDRRSGHRHRIDRSGQALAEWDGGELQRQVPRRVPEPGMVPFAERGEGGDRELAAALQRGAAAFEPGLPDAGRVRRAPQAPGTAPAQATGQRAAAHGAS